MTLRVLVYILLAALLYWGLRSIVRDWKRKFAADDTEERKRLEAQLARNRKEARNPDVIALKRDEDGVYRPNGKDDPQ